jgi:hypothetical protein
MGRLRNNFNWKTKEGLSLGADVTKATVTTGR